MLSISQFDLQDGAYGTCSSPHVGYSIDPTIISTLGLSSSLYDIVTEVFTGFLIIHPVMYVCSLVFRTLLGTQAYFAEPV